MPIPVYDKEADIPEAFRDEYVERDGKWHLNVEDVSGLKSALEKKKNEAKEKADALKKAQDELDAMKRDIDAKKSGITDDQLQKLRDEDAAKRKPLEDQIASLTAQLTKLRLDDQVRHLGLKHGWVPERVENAMRDLRAQNDGKGRLTLNEQGTIIVLDAKGQTTTETLEDFLKTTYAKESPWFYVDNGASGTGSSTSAANGSVSGSYDPVKAGKEAAERQKRDAKTNELAFR